MNRPSFKFWIKSVPVMITIALLFIYWFVWISWRDEDEGEDE